MTGPHIQPTEGSQHTVRDGCGFTFTPHGSLALEKSLAYFANNCAWLLFFFFLLIADQCVSLQLDPAVKPPPPHRSPTPQEIHTFSSM